MNNLRILNTKEIKDILAHIKEQWGADFKTDLAFLQNTKDRVFLVTKELATLDTKTLRINAAGIYFCELDKAGIRLSIEGAQLIGPLATKNILVIPDDQVRMWLSGQDVPTDEELNGFVIIKNKQDYLGSGKIARGKILNYVTKSRRISAQ